jgi:DNA-directed RNA polymerase specialized sigma24 family protein
MGDLGDAERRVTEVLDAEVPDGSWHAGALGAIEDRSHLAAALDALTARQRTVVVLRYCEDLSEADVAALMGCRVGTVKSQAAKALAKLRANPSLLSHPVRPLAEEARP